jgi:hypothetical protein
MKVMTPKAKLTSLFIFCQQYQSDNQIHIPSGTHQSLKAGKTSVSGRALQ